jgi:hypothetical protein
MVWPRRSSKKKNLTINTCSVFSISLITVCQSHVGEDRPKIGHVTYVAESHRGTKWSDADVLPNKRRVIMEIYSLEGMAHTELFTHSKHVPASHAKFWPSSFVITNEWIPI